MKKLILLLALSIWFFSCKKENVNPQTTIQHDTVHTTTTVIQHDTAYCTPLSDIIQGTWYCYKINSTLNAISEQVNFTQTSLTWPSEFANTTVIFNSSYSYYMDSQTNQYYVSIFNCSEIKILDSHGKNYYLRRAP
jgi:hypothetical protein